MSEWRRLRLLVLRSTGGTGMDPVIEVVAWSLLLAGAIGFEMYLMRRS
jgi:hypothetical protein